MLKKDGESIPFTRLQAIITTVCAVLGLMYVVLPAHDAALLKDADTRARLNALETAAKSPPVVSQTMTVKLEPKVEQAIFEILKIDKGIDTWLTYSPGGIKDSQRKGK